MLNYIFVGINIIKHIFSKRTPVTNEILVIIIAIIVIFYGYTKYKNTESQKLELEKSLSQYHQALVNYKQKIEILQKNVEEQQKTYEAQIQDYKNIINRLKKLFEKEQNRAKVVVKYRTKVIYVDKKDNGPIAPVLRNTFIWLRKQMQLPGTQGKSDNSN